MIDQPVIAGGFLVAFAGFQDQWPHANKAVHDIIMAERPRQIAVGGGEQIAHLRIAHLRILGALHIAFGGADQRIVALIRDDEDDAAIRLLQHEGIAAQMHAAGDDVAALHQPQRRRIVQAHHPAGDILGPWPGSIDQAAGAQRAAIPQCELPQAIHPLGTGHRGARQHQRAARPRILQIFHHQPGIIHPAIPIAEGAAIIAGQRAAGPFAAQINAFRTRHHLAAGKIVIEQGAQPQQPFRPHARRVRQHKGLRPGDVRRDVEQHLAFGQRLAHQPEGIIFQIPEAAVDQLGRS